MHRLPDLVAPVIVVACALIVAGGIGTALADGGDPGPGASSPVVEQGRAAPLPSLTAGARAGAAMTIAGSASAGEWAGGAPNSTGLFPNATALQSVETADGEQGLPGPGGSRDRP